MSREENLGLFLSALDAIAKGEEFSDEVEEWIRTALYDHYRIGASVDVSLGIKGERGERTLGELTRKSFRNRYLYQAWDAAGRPETSDDWKEFHRKVKRFGSDVWPRWKDRVEPPEQDPFRVALFHAYSNDRNLFESWERLRDAVIQGAKDF